MKVFEINKKADKYSIKFLGKRIFSFTTKFKYKKLYKKRFKGLTEKEARYFLETQFERTTGYKLNLDNPQTFNEEESLAIAEYYDNSVELRFKEYEEVFYKGFREAYYFFERSNMIKEYEEE